MRRDRIGIWLLASTMAMLVGLGIGFAEDPEAGEQPVSAEQPAAPEPADEAAPAASPDLPGTAEFVGADTCLSCHDAQSGFKHQPHGQSLLLKKGISFDKSCETCHGPGSLHAAAAGDRSNPGFASIKEFKKLSADAANASCLECHQSATRSHWNSGAHAAADVSCVSCHSVHAPKGKAQLAKASESETCFQCHSNIKSQIRRTGHMPVDGSMSCSSCHNPHGSGRDKMINEASVSTLCYKCHQDKRGPFLFEHAPVREDCTSCHAPHGSLRDNMLVVNAPMLCQRCHNASGHNAQAYSGADVTTGSARMLGHSCVNCHSNIHGSNHPSGKYFLR